MSKGSWNRTGNYASYRNSPLWGNKDAKPKPCGSTVFTVEFLTDGEWTYYGEFPTMEWAIDESVDQLTYKITGVKIQAYTPH